MLEYSWSFKVLPVNEQLNEFDYYRSYRATDYGQNYFKGTKKLVPFHVPVFCFQLFPNLFLLYTNQPTKSQKTGVTSKDFQNGLEEQTVEHKE